MDGVAIGLKGIVKAVYKEPSGEYTINIGIFTVRKVFERTAEVDDRDRQGTESRRCPLRGFRSRPGLPRKQDRSLDPRQSRGKRRLAPGPGRQGRRSRANSNPPWSTTRKPCPLEPKNLVAQEKCNEMKKEIAGAERKVKFNEYLKKADGNYEKNDVKYAFLYVIEALRMYPEGSSEVKGRLVMMARRVSPGMECDLKGKTRRAAGHPSQDRCHA